MNGLHGSVKIWWWEKFMSSCKPRNWTPLKLLKQVVLKWNISLKLGTSLWYRIGCSYHKIKPIHQDQPSLQFALLTSHWMQACHDNICHLGIDHTLELLWDRFYLPDMKLDVEQHIKTYDQCLHFKAKPQHAELHPILATHYMGLVHINFLTVESGKGDKEVNILVVMDHFTRYVQACVTPSQTATVIAQTLWDKYFMHYGLPENTVSDQCHSFESCLILELCVVSQTKKLCTVPCWQKTNGQCECLNSTLISMLGTLDSASKLKWPQQLTMLVHVYNSTRSTATGFKPFFSCMHANPCSPYMWSEV